MDRNLRLEEIKTQIDKLNAEYDLLNRDTEIESLKKDGYYIPLATAKVVCDLYNKGGYNFSNMKENDDWYTVEQLLGDPDLKKGTKVVLIKIGEETFYWYPEQSDGNYIDIEEEFIGMENSDENRLYYLEEILYIK